MWLGEHKLQKSEVDPVGMMEAKGEKVIQTQEEQAAGLLSGGK